MLRLTTTVNSSVSFWGSSGSGYLDSSRNPVSRGNFSFGQTFETDSELRDMSSSSLDALDLYEVGLLLNYERAATDPKFRHRKLVEVTSSTFKFKEIAFRDPRATKWWTHRLGPKLGLVFRHVPTNQEDKDLPDLPSNMLPDPVPATLQNLTPQQLESYYWQARGHDGCFTSMTLFQYFFDLFDEDQPLRVRTDSGYDYVTTISQRRIVEWTLAHPHLLTVSFIADTGMVHTTGQTDTAPHSVMVFFDEADQRQVAVDLASMQFGEVGRGLRGRSTFVVEPVDAYLNRLKTFAEEKRDEKISLGINSHPDRETDRRLKNLAKKVKARWEKRKSEPYCGHCGAPEAKKKCSKCTAHYCNREHQLAAWPLHKKVCS